MTLKEACELIRPRIDGSSITFARVFVNPFTEATPSALERLLEEQRVIRFARQEHGTRTYHVVHKRLEEVLEDGA